MNSWQTNLYTPVRNTANAATRWVKHEHELHGRGQGSTTSTMTVVIGDLCGNTHYNQRIAVKNSRGDPLSNLEIYRKKFSFLCKKGVYFFLAEKHAPQQFPLLDGNIVAPFF